MLPLAALNPFWNQAQNSQTSKQLRCSNLWIMFLSLSVHSFIPNPRTSEDQKGPHFSVLMRLICMGMKRKIFVLFSCLFLSVDFMNHQ